MNRRAMGHGTLFVGEREFVNVEYFVTTVGYESATIGLITLTPGESKDGSFGSHVVDIDRTCDIAGEPKQASLEHLARFRQPLTGADLVNHMRSC